MGPRSSQRWMPAAAIATSLLALAAPVAAQTAKLVPMPASLSPAAGSFTIATGAGVAADDDGAHTAAGILAQRVATQRGLKLTLTGGDAIRFVRDASVKGEEAYRLTVTDKGIRIAASGDCGMLYGAMTLAQLLSPDNAVGQPVRVPAMTIEDAPRFAWRGYMADVARHFQPIGALYKTVDQMAALKLNTLHLHLSDDQGWRVEIKRYPKLTEIGAWRTSPTGGGAPPAKPYGGFYTQDELKALVAYAAERGITIVPEIDLPGHAQAIVASYPEYGVFGDRPQVSGDWGVNPYLIDPSEKGIAVVENILDEIMAIFPGQYIHVGGDEAVKDQWQRSPRVQAIMKAKGIATENALQSMLIREFDAYLRAHGRRLIGWDEILDGGGLPKSATVMSWQGEKGAIQASAAGHDVVLSPAPILYLDNLQSWLPDEPPQRPANPPMTLEKVYGYDAMPAAIAPENRSHVLGAQMNAWSEYLMTADMAWRATYPRLAAFSEGVWSTGKRDFGGFLDRLEPQMARWKRDGIPAADSAFAVDYSVQGERSAAIKAGRVTVALSNQTAHGAIRYTTDGSTPGPRSALYARPVQVKVGATIRAAAFGTDGAISTPRAFDASRAGLLSVNSTYLSACSGGIELRLPLTPDSGAMQPAYNSNIFDGCLVWRKAPLSAATGFTVSVARLARNFGLAHDFNKPKAYYPATRFGELIVRAAGCDGPPVATFPLPDPATAPNQFDVSGALPAGTADGDLCMTFTAPVSGPLYAVSKVQLGSRE